MKSSQGVETGEAQNQARESEKENKSVEEQARMKSPTMQARSREIKIQKSVGRGSNSTHKIPSGKLRREHKHYTLYL